MKSSWTELLTSNRRCVMYLPGGGITGALYQLGALAALEDSIPTFRANLLNGYVAVGSGAILSMALAGDLEVQRLYRAILDPADNFFPLERRHILRLDLGEWRRTFGAGFKAFRRVLTSLRNSPVETASDPWGEIDRFHDVLPAGFFSLESFERFLDVFLERRGIGTTFRTLSKPLIIPVHDLNTGELVLFGTSGYEHERVARVACASMALPLFFAPVRIGDRLYFAGSTGNATSLDIAIHNLNAEVVLVINPLVPLVSHQGSTLANEKGLLWIYNQAMRIGEHRRLTTEIALLKTLYPQIEILLIEPSEQDSALFMHSPMNYSVRRTILEEAYHSVRSHIEDSTS